MRAELQKPVDQKTTWWFWKKFLYQLKELERHGVPELLEEYSQVHRASLMFNDLSDGSRLVSLYWSDTFSMTKRHHVESVLTVLLPFSTKATSTMMRGTCVLMHLGWATKSRLCCCVCWDAITSTRLVEAEGGSKRSWSTRDGPTWTMWLTRWRKVLGICGRL